MFHLFTVLSLVMTHNLEKMREVKVDNVSHNAALSNLTNESGGKVGNHNRPVQFGMSYLLVFNELGSLLNSSPVGIISLHSLHLFFCLLQS